MNPDEICAKILSLRDTEALQERVVNELVQEMVDLEPVKFELVVNSYIKLNGIEKTIREIIFPFLEKIGILWQTGHIMPAQEHFVSNIIRQKLIVAIDEIGCRNQGKPCVLFLPEGEYHELGLLFLSYLLKRHGCRIIYLGSNVPLCDVQSIVETMKPELAFIHLTSTSPNFNLERLIRNLQVRTGTLQTYISGYPTHHYHKELPPSITLKRSLHEVLELISTM